MAFVITYKHKENIQRLLSGTENKLIFWNFRGVEHIVCATRVFVVIYPSPHHQNIRRLFKGDEPRIGAKKST